MTQEEKQIAHDILCKRYDETARKAVAAIETRLSDYFDGLIAEPDMHNGYEILCAVKFLRLLRTYEFNERKVRQVVRLREGEWKQDSRGRWQHVRGGIQCPGTDTAHVYRWQPFQVFVLASVFGFYTWFDTEVRAIDKPTLLLTEREREDGMVEDFRRLCNYFVMYTPRKTDKTGMSAYIQLVFFLLGDYNSEIYCCANAEFQANILYTRVQFMLRDVDTKHRFRMTAKITDWKKKYQDIRNASIMPMTAGGKTKDGPFAELVNWDEGGSSPYVNGKSDMFSLVDVMRSSMGPRREGLTFGTTTAGTIKSGPFKDEMLPGLHTSLMKELKYESGEAQPTLSDDRSLCLMLEPDDWEKTDIDKYIYDKALRRKINPMLGVTCQHQFYEDSITDMHNGKMTRGELVSKLFNVYDSETVKTWIRGDRIRPLQRNMRITDCKYEDGWQVFVGMDFSHGDDLFATAYFGVNMNHEPKGRFFADCEAWVLEKVLLESPNRKLYELLIEQGWLHVCPGEVWDPMLAIQKIAEKNMAGVNLVYFGYDPAQSITPINYLKAWLQSLGIDPKDVVNMVVPVGQSAMVQNPRISEMEELILSNDELLYFSMSPLWPFCFGNCAVELNSSDLRRVVKGGPAQTAKIDPVAALQDAIYCFDLSEGRVEK